MDRFFTPLGIHSCGCKLGDLIEESGAMSSPEDTTKKLLEGNAL